MRSRRQRNADVKLILAATVAVLLAGGLIAIGLLVATDDSSRTHCGRLPAGSADELRRELEGGPFFQTGGEGCSFWLSLDQGDIVAYKVDQPSGCSLQPQQGEWRCGSDVVDVSELATYPVAIETVDGVDTVVVDLNPPGVATTTTTTTTTT